MQRVLWFFSLVSLALLVVVQSWRLVAPWAPCVEVQRKEAGWRSGSHNHSGLEWHVRRIGAREHVHAGNEALGSDAESHQGIVVAARKGYARPVQNVDRIRMTKQAAESSCLVFGKHRQPEGRNSTQIQRAVLVDEMGNEVLTWAGMGNPDAQTCED